MTSFLIRCGITALAIAMLAACAAAPDLIQAPASQPNVGAELTEEELNRLLEDIIAF